jgi:hypothetical protein
MNRPLIALIAFLSAASVHAQEVNYIDIAEDSGSASIRVLKIDDFASLVKAHKIQNVLRSKDRFVVQVDAVLYTIDSAGFMTIPDYRNGKETFETGAAYYVALKQGLKTKAEVDYFNGELFANGEDYAAALKAGFVHNSMKLKPRGVVGLSRKVDLERNIRAANALLAIKQRLGDKDENVDDVLANKDLAFLEKNSYGAIQAVDPDTYYIAITTDWLATPGKKQSSTNAQMRTPQSGDSPLESDAVIYYLAILGQYATPTETQEATLNSKIVKEALTIRGTPELLKSTGFINFTQVSPAISLGFTNGADYSLAMEYRMTNRAEYDIYKDQIAEYEKTMKTYGLKQKIEAPIVKKLLAMQKGVLITFDRFAEQYNTEASADALLKRFGNKITGSTVAALIKQTPDIFSQFVVDTDGKSMYKK